MATYRSIAVVVGGLLTFLMVVSDSQALLEKTKKEDQEPRPRLKLQADIQAGFVPLNIHFTGRLRNVKVDNDAFCHAGTFLLLKTGDDLRLLAGEDPSCIHSPDKSEVPLTFSYIFEIQRPGIYEFVAMVETKDGQSFVSNGVPVRAVSSPAAGR